MNPREVYFGSDGGMTSEFYRLLKTYGPIGEVCVALFRAQKCSERAKVYKGGIPGQGTYSGMAYDRKQWSMGEVCKILAKHSKALGINYGWKIDPRTKFQGRSSWVLYVDTPAGQVSFHSPHRGDGPHYTGDWDNRKRSVDRVLELCDQILEGVSDEYVPEALGRAEG